MIDRHCGIFLLCRPLPLLHDHHREGSQGDHRVVSYFAVKFTGESLHACDRATRVLKYYPLHASLHMITRCNYVRCTVHSVLCNQIYFLFPFQLFSISFDLR